VLVHSLTNDIGSKISLKWHSCHNVSQLKVHYDKADSFGVKSLDVIFLLSCLVTLRLSLERSVRVHVKRTNAACAADSRVSEILFYPPEKVAQSAPGHCVVSPDWILYIPLESKVCWATKFVAVWPCLA
jgi:hypothetical protein